MIVEGIDIDKFVEIANNDETRHGFSVIQEAKIVSSNNFIRWDKILSASKDKLDPKAFAFLLHILWQAYSYEVDGYITYDLFRNADKKYLMSEEEQKTLIELPKKIKVYRGSQDVSKGTNISWSLSEDRAKWFAGEVFVEAEVEKDIVAAYFEREKEVICPPDLFYDAIRKKNY